jgi:hypothetical protein
MKYGKRDQNHTSLVRDLRSQGVEVREMMLPLDLLTYLHEMVWVEVKMPGSRACYTRTQLQFCADTRMPILIAKDATEAINALKQRAYLSQKQKDNIAGMLIRSAKDKFTPNEVDGAIGDR